MTRSRKRVSATPIIRAAGARQNQTANHFHSDRHLEALESRRLLSTTSLVTPFGTGGKTQFDNIGGREQAADVVSDSIGRIISLAEMSPTDGSRVNLVLTRHLPNGQLDTSFGVNGSTYIFTGSGVQIQNASLAINLASGDIVAVANFINSTPDVFIAKLTPNGGMDTNFDSDGIVTLDLGDRLIGGPSDTRINAVAIDSGGKILLAGSTNQRNSGGSELAVIRLTAAGAPDPSFVDTSGVYINANIGAGSSAQAITTLGNTTYVAGVKPLGSGPNDLVMLALDNSGSAFLSGSLGFSSDIALHGLTYDALADRFLVPVEDAVNPTRFNVAGFLGLNLNPDSSFGSGGFASSFNLPTPANPAIATEVVRGSDNAYYVTGSYQAATTRLQAVTRFSLTGVPDSNFATVGTLTVDFGPNLPFSGSTQGAVISPDLTKLVLVSSGDKNDIVLSGVDLTTRALNSSFGTSGRVVFNGRGANDTIIDQVQLPSGDLVVLVESRFGGDFPTAEIRRISGSTGSVMYSQPLVLQSDLEPDSQLLYVGIELAPNDKIIVAARRSSSSGGAEFVVAQRLLASNGSLDTTFNLAGTIDSFFGNSSAVITDVTTDDTGRLLVAGRDSGSPGGAIVLRFNSSGLQDSTFGNSNPGRTIVNSFSVPSSVDVNDIIVFSDGNIYLAGDSFDVTLQRDIGFVARLDTSGFLDNSFGSSGFVNVDLPSASNENSAELFVPLPNGKLGVVASGLGVSTGITQLVSFDPASSPLLPQFSAQFPVNFSAGSSLVTADGRVLLAGTGTTSGGTDLSLIEIASDLTNPGQRYDPNGRVNLSGLSFRSVSGLALLSNGSLALFGSSTSQSGNSFDGPDAQIVNIVGEDMTAPFASVNQSQVKIRIGAPGTAGDRFSIDISFGDAVLLNNTFFFDEGNISVTGPAGQLVSLGPPAITARTDNFTLQKSDGTPFTPADLGTYTVTFGSANNVVDAAGNTVPGGTAIGTFQLAAFDVDVAVSSISVLTPQVNPGQTLSYSATFVNNSENNLAVTARVGTYLSDDGVFDPNTDILLGFSNVTLTANQTQTVSFSATAPVLPASLGRKVFIVYDDTLAVFESDENNNIATSFDLQQISTTSQVDLGWQSFSAVQNPYIPGGSVPISGSFANFGGTNAASATVQFFLSTDSSLSMDDVSLQNASFSLNAFASSSLSGQGISSVSLPSNTTAGSYFIIAQIDSVDPNNPDADTSNNFISDSITVALPDLLIQQGNQVNYGALLPGDAISFTVDASNAGLVSSPSSQVTFFLSSDTTFDQNDFPLFTQGLTSIAPNQPPALISVSGSTTLPTSGIATGSSLFLLAVVDPNGLVFDADPTNNTGVVGTLFVASSSAADLAVDSISVPSVIQPGQSLSFSAQIINLGQATASPVSVKLVQSADGLFDVSDLVLLQDALSFTSLPGGDQSTYTITFNLPNNLPTGSQNLILILDPDGLSPDANASNNQLAVPVTVSVQPVDLTPTAITFTSTPARRNDVLPATVTVLNAGSGTVGSFELRVTLSTDSTLDFSDTVLGTVTGGAISGNNSIDVSLSSLIVPFNLPNGSYFVFVEVDAFQQVTETDESNNTFVSPSVLTVADPLLSVTATNDSNALLAALLGQNSGLIVRSFTVSGQNSGVAFSTGTYTNAGNIYGIGPGIVLSTGDVNSLNSGPTTEFAGFSFSTPASPTDDLLLDPITGDVDHSDVTRIDLVVDLAAGLDSIFFNVVFGSEEFPTFVNSNFVDAFGLFVNGLNIASTGGNPLSIRTPGFSAIPGTALNGVLAPTGEAVLRFGSFVGLGAQNVTLTFIIADSTDSGFDTAAFISSLSAISNPGVPQASPTAPDVVSNTPDTLYTFTVTYTDDTGIATSTLDSNDIRVTGPNGFESAATFNSFISTSSTTVVATYSILAPGGSFDSADLGTYSIILQPGQVQDTGGTFVPSGMIGSFAVIPPAAGNVTDLIVTALSVPAGTYAPSEPLFFSATVNNTGGLAAGSFSVGFFLSTDAIFDASDTLLLSVPVASLSGSSNSTLSNLTAAVPSTLALGSYFLLAVADPTNQIVESTDTNNTFATNSSIINIDLPIPPTPPVLTPGGLDTDFGVQGVVTTVFVDAPAFTTTDARRAANGQLVTTGFTLNTAADLFLTRFNADGTADTTFAGGLGLITLNLGGTDRPRSITFDDAGRILVSGFVRQTLPNSTATFDSPFIARFSADGILDSSFGATATPGFSVFDLSSILSMPASSGQINGIAFDNQGNLLLAGEVSVMNGNPDMLLGRLLPSGLPDTTFGNNGFVIASFGAGIDSAQGISFDSRSNKVVIAGYASTFGAVSAFAAARFNSNGSLDSSFGQGGRVIQRISITDSRAYAVAVRPNGGLFLGGYSARGNVSSPTFDSDAAIVALDSRGNIDRSFGGGIVNTNFAGFIASITDLLVSPDGRVVFSAKLASNLNSTADPLLGVATARFTTAGQLDQTFGVNGISIVFDVPNSVTPAAAGRDDVNLSESFDAFITSRRGLIEGTEGGRIQALTDSLTPTGDTKVQIAQFLGDASDLVAVLVSRLNDPVSPNDRGSATITLTNQGSAAASGTISVPLFLSADQILDSSDILLTTVENVRLNNLSPSRSQRISARFVFPVNLASGQYFLLADVDSGRTVAENNVANNTAVGPGFTFSQPTVDLSPLFASTPSALTSGSRATFSITVTNSGSDTVRTPTGGTATLRLFRSADGVLTEADDLLGSSELRLNLAPGRSRTLRLNFDLPAGLSTGSFNLVARIDFDPDANPANNTTFSSAPVTFE